MDNKYRLRREAVPFFDSKYGRATMDLQAWKTLGVSVLNSLEEVKEPYLTYGHKDADTGVRHCSKWGGAEGGVFRFEIHFPSQRNSEYEAFSEDGSIRNMMDAMEKVVVRHYENHVNSEL